MSTWTTYRYMHTYIDTYIHRYSEFAICYSCIRGSLRLALNYETLLDNNANPKVGSANIPKWALIWEGIYGIKSDKQLLKHHEAIATSIHVVCMHQLQL